MLTLDSVQVALGDRHWNFDISLATNGVYALQGRSGSGKSTFLNIIAGFLYPSVGNILWNEQSLLSLDPAQRPVTSLFQQYNLFSHLNVFQNVALGINPGLNLTTEQRENVSKVLTQVGLQGYEYKRPGNLSGGEQQRVSLARCLLRQRPILLLDEPFSALDATTRAEMIFLLRNLVASYKPCVVMVTHDENDTKAMHAEVLKMKGNTVSFDNCTQ